MNSSAWTSDPPASGSSRSRHAIEWIRRTPNRARSSTYHCRSGAGSGAAGIGTTIRPLTGVRWVEGARWVPSRGLTDVLDIPETSDAVEEVAHVPFVLGGSLRWRGLQRLVEGRAGDRRRPGLRRSPGSRACIGPPGRRWKRASCSSSPASCSRARSRTSTSSTSTALAPSTRSPSGTGSAGYTLEAERTFGLLQHLGIIFAIYALTRAWGRVSAVGAACITALLILTPIGLSALAWHGAVALALWAIVFAVRATRTGRTRNWVVGRAAGRARPDVPTRHRAGDRLRVAVRVLVATAHRAGSRCSSALAVGLIPMWVHLVARRSDQRGRRGSFLDPVFHLRAGRELPRPAVVGRRRRCAAGGRRRVCRRGGDCPRPRHRSSCSCGSSPW